MTPPTFWVLLGKSAQKVGGILNTVISVKAMQKLGYRLYELTGRWISTVSANKIADVLGEARSTFSRLSHIDFDAVA